MKPSRLGHMLAAGMVIWALGGCARATTVGSDRADVFAIQVRNAMNHTMIVYYRDTTGPHRLGAVAGGKEERFVIARPASTSIAVTATDEGETHTAGPYDVVLSAGTVVRVIIQ